MGHAVGYASRSQTTPSVEVRKICKRLFTVINRPLIKEMNLPTGAIEDSQSKPLVDVSWRSPAAINRPLPYVTVKRLMSAGNGNLPEIQFRPSTEVRIVPQSPTAANLPWPKVMLVSQLT